MMYDAIIDEAIRKVPDFPKPGVLFYDLTSLLADPSAFEHTMRRMNDIYADETLDAVAAIEARGFLVAAPFALNRGLPLILLRKRGKLPGKVISRRFDLEYGSDTIEVHADDVPRNGRVLVIDDLIATGGTIQAACELLEEGGANVAGVFAVVALPFLRFFDRLGDRSVRFLQEYAEE